MTVCESDSGLCWDLDEETLARAILTFCLNTADALMTALLKGTADAWEALTLIRDSDPGTAHVGRRGEGHRAGVLHRHDPMGEQAHAAGGAFVSLRVGDMAAAIANSPHVGQGLSLRLVHHGGEAMDHRAA